MADDSYFVDVMCLDCCKMFDEVLHNILIENLVLCNINRTYVKWIKNWLSDRSKAVVSEESSLIRGVSSGVLQGLGFSLILFNISNDQKVKYKLTAVNDTKMSGRASNEEDKNPCKSVYFEIMNAGTPVEGRTLFCKQVTLKRV